MSPELEQPEQPSDHAETRHHPAAAAPQDGGGILQRLQQDKEGEEHGNARISTVIDNDHDYLNGMDDLLSFGSPCSHGEGGMGGPTSEDDDNYSVRGDDILTPSGAMIMSPVPASDSPDWRPLLNAVHMELQENAKLPTFHWNVNRTGSAQNHSGTGRVRPPLD